MCRNCLSCSLLAAVSLLSTTAFAAEKSILGTIDAVDAAQQVIVVGDQKLDVVRKTGITVNGKAATLADRINRDAVALLKRADVTGKLTTLSLDVGATSPADTTKFFAGETTLWRRVIKEAAIPLQ